MTIAFQLVFMDPVSLSTSSSPSSRSPLSSSPPSSSPPSLSPLGDATGGARAFKASLSVLSSSSAPSSQNNGNVNISGKDNNIYGNAPTLGYGNGGRNPAIGGIGGDYGSGSGSVGGRPFSSNLSAEGEGLGSR
jgi:hypothetical protein